MVNWANEHDHWVRALVARILDTRRALGTNEIDELYDLFLREKNLADGNPVSIPLLVNNGRPGDAEQALRLSTLSDVRNVNALADGQDIAFNRQMTVLYGENGAGKTGYVRILKHIAAVRTADETIIPNITSSGLAGSPSASITFQIGERTDAYSWKGEKGVPPFTRIDVFDERGVDIHVDGELTYVYTPGELAIFRYTHDALEAVRKQLDDAREKAAPIGNPYLNKFSREGALYTKIETLGAATDLHELEQLGSITEEDRAQLAPLQERVDALRSGTSSATLQVARAEKELLERIKAAITTAEDFDSKSYAQALDSVRVAERAHTHATNEALSGEKIPGFLEETWRRFIETGQTYVREHKSTAYPQHGDTCPYCLQELSSAAVNIVRKYQDFCRSDLQDSLDKARVHLEASIEPLTGLDTERLARDVQSRIDAVAPNALPHSSLTIARDFIVALQSAQVMANDGQNLDTTALQSAASAARLQVDARLEELQKLVQDLQSDLSARKELLSTESTKLTRLQDHFTLSELLPGVRQYVLNAKWASRAKTFVDKFRQLGKTLTETSKLAGEQVLNNDFQVTFKEECKALRAPAVTLDFPGRKGQPARRKTLTPQFRLKAILSEGEQKVIALADFIAEATLRRSPTPLVFDDPVTSLDYKRLQYVVDRLVQLSETRQVIVFTHNIWFTMELLGRFENNRKGCAYYDVCEDGIKRGVVSAGTSPKLDTWADKKKRLNLLVQRIKQEKEKTIRDVLIEKGYEDLRGACEIVVEQDLLQRVVQSYSPNVMVGNLTRLKFDDLPQASGTVNEIFEKCCRFIGSHKQPLETLSVRPTLEQLEADWASLQAVHSVFTN